MTPKIIIVCAWCSTSAAWTKALTDAGFIVSHGICPDCAAKWSDL